MAKQTNKCQELHNILSRHKQYCHLRADMSSTFTNLCLSMTSQRVREFKQVQLLVLDHSGLPLLWLCHSTFFDWTQSMDSMSACCNKCSVANSTTHMTVCLGQAAELELAFESAVTMEHTF